MDNQEATQQDNIGKDAPLLNLSAQDDVSKQTPESPIPLYAPEPGQEPEQKTEAAERPEYLPEQFWKDDAPDVENLAKSYNELRKKFSQGKHKAPEDDYDIKNLVDQGLNTDDPAVGIYKSWAKENGISQAAFEDLAAQVLQVANDDATQYEYDRQAEMQKLGERANEKVQMAERLLMKAPLTNSEREAMADSLSSADAINAFLKYHSSLTNEGIPLQPSAQSPEMTREDLEGAIADPRWQTDVGFRTKVEKQWLNSQN